MNRTSIWQHLALSVTLAAGLTGFTGLLSAQNNDGNGVQAAQRQLEVRNAQQSLKNQGYYTGNVDGVFGQTTRDAIRRYQRANKLTVNGRLDHETTELLSGAGGEANRSADAAGALRNGASPETAAVLNKNGATNTKTVEAAQRQLQQQAMYSGAIDGVMGGKTSSAIREYQRKNGLPVTGILDEATLTSLGVSR